MPIPILPALLDVAPSPPRIADLPPDLTVALVAALVAAAAFLLVLRVRRRK